MLKHERRAHGGRHRAVRAAHRAPDDPVEQQVFHRVFPGEVHFELAAPRVRAVPLFQIDVGRLRPVRAQIRRGLEGVEHRRGGGVELRHRLEAQDQFHRAEHAAGRIHG